METIKIKINLNKKQDQAWQILHDKIHTEIFYGGGAGGGKSYLGCAWIVLNCLTYEESRWLIGRAILKHLKDSTLLTFFKVCKDWGLKSNEDYTYNAMDGTIKFSNGSAVYLRDLFLYPSDPEFDSLGSTEFTGAFIDEASQIKEKAKNIVMSRIRYKLDEFKIIPKLLVASNPSKNFLYFDFYKPWKEGTLESYRAFIPALVGDNPFISKYYEENLHKLDKISRERLLYGNFEYDDDPTRLFDYDAILDLFTNTAERGEKYCTIDVAGRGGDRTIVIIWDGLFIEKVYNMEDISVVELDNILTTHKIPRSRCIADEDGVGYGLVLNASGIKGFINGSKPIHGKKESEKESVMHNYANLKAQCWFELANYVNSGLIGIYRDIDVETKRILIEDLEQIKQKDPGKDQPLRILTKEDIKEVLGRSTDVGDAMMMRMYFNLHKPMGSGFITINKIAEKANQITEREKKIKEENAAEIKKLVAEGQISFGPTVKGKKEREIQSNNNL